MTKRTRSSVADIGVARGVSAARKKLIRSIGVNLCEARLAAESIQNPVMAYFIDMAIAEVRQMTIVHQEMPLLQDGRDEANVLRFLKSPAKGALPI
jgi:hypothetical protein